MLPFVKAYTIFYGERKIWWLRVRAEGPTGHGSRFVQGTAVSKLIRFCNRMLEFRGAQEMQLTLHNGLKLGDVTTINLNSLIAGVSGGPDGNNMFVCPPTCPYPHIYYYLITFLLTLY